MTRRQPIHTEIALREVNNCEARDECACPVAKVQAYFSGRYGDVPLKSWQLYKMKTQVEVCSASLDVKRKVASALDHAFKAEASAMVGLSGRKSDDVW